MKQKGNTVLLISNWLLFSLLAFAVLSQRLGLGKGGLRMAPEEALAEILQVHAALHLFYVTILQYMLLAFVNAFMFLTTCF